MDTPNSETYDDDAKADTHYDQENGIFWTWQGPYAIKQTCEGVKKTGIGGQMIFAVGMDLTELTHWDAWTECVKDWN